MRLLLIYVCWLLSFSYVFASGIHLQGVDLADAIKIVAQQAHVNVMVSSDIAGVIDLDLKDVKPKDMMRVLLLSHNLGELDVGDLLYIAPQASLAKYVQDKRKFASLELGSLQTQIWQIQYAQAESIVKMLRTQLQAHSSNSVVDGAHISFDTRTNKIVMRDYTKQLAMVDQLIKKLDVPIKQVMIETRLVSVDVDEESQLGLEFATRSQSTYSHEMMPLAETGRVVLTVAKLADSSRLDVMLSALEQEGKADLISSPSLFANSQQEASIEAGEEVPYQEVSRSGGTAVAFKKAVLGLKVKPQVLPRDRVMLALQINQDRPASRMIGGVPAISTRQIKTNVLLKDGETAVLGGIYETNHEKNRTSVPFLGRIPLIGLLFTHETMRENKRELLIFVTPRIKTI